MNIFQKVYFYTFIVGFFCALIILNNRRIYENQNRKVETILDFQEILQYTKLNNIPFEQFLQLAKKLNIISFAIPEITLEDLAESKIVYVNSISEIQTNDFPTIKDKIDPYSSVLSIPKRKNAEKICKILKLYFPNLFCSVNYYKSIIIIPVKKEDALKIPLGILNVPQNPIKEKINLIINNGFKIVPRLTYVPFETKASIVERIRDVKLIRGSSILIFYGDKVIGFPHLTKELYDSIKKFKLKVGVIEFFKQEGIEDVIKNIPDKIFIVHSISEKELLLFKPESYSRRFIRAVRERNIRFLYIRIFKEVPQDFSNQVNFDYISSIIKGLKNEGFIISEVYSKMNFKQNYFLVILTMLGCISYIALLLTAYVRPKILLDFLFISISIILLIVFINSIHFHMLISLLASILIPILSLNLIFLNTTTWEKISEKIKLKDSILFWVKLTLLNIVGGIFISAMLSKNEFFSKVEEFRGVKLALIIPLIASIIIYLKNIKGIKLKQLLVRNFHFYDAFGWAFFVAVIGIMLIRSGNPSILPSIPFEELVRNSLELFFKIRPRTKEFLIGHPFLILSTFPFFSKRMSPFLIIIGFIGQISIVNSFCHIHTPIILTFLRTFIGIGLGGILGIVLWTIIYGFFKLKLFGRS